MIFLPHAARLIDWAQPESEGEIECAFRRMEGQVRVRQTVPCRPVGGLCRRGLPTQPGEKSATLPSGGAISRLAMPRNAPALAGFWSSRGHPWPGRALPGEHREGRRITGAGRLPSTGLSQTPASSYRARRAGHAPRMRQRVYACVRPLHWVTLGLSKSAHPSARSFPTLVISSAAEVIPATTAGAGEICAWGPSFIDG